MGACLSTKTVHHYRLMHCCTLGSHYELSQNLNTGGCAQSKGKARKLDSTGTGDVKVKALQSINSDKCGQGDELNKARMRQDCTLKLENTV